MTAYARRVAIGFTVGGIVALLAMLLPLLTPILKGPLAPLLIPLGFIIGGAIGGAALKISRKVVIGFSIGFLIPGLVVPLILIGFVPSMLTGIQDWFFTLSDKILVLLIFALIFGLVFGLAGAIGAAFMAQGFRIIRAGVAGFGVGGVIGGAVAVLLNSFKPTLLVMKEGLGSLGSFMLLAGIIVGLLIPYFIGGAILGAAAEKAVAHHSEEKSRNIE